MIGLYILLLFLMCYCVTTITPSETKGMFTEPHIWYENMPHKITVLSTNHGFCPALKMLVTWVKPGKYVTLNSIYFYIDKELCNPN